MRIIHALYCLALMARPAAAASEDKPVPILAKASKWEVKYDADACHLAARFGEGSQAIVMRLTRYSLADSFDLTLTGESLAVRQKRPGFEIGFAPTAKLQQRLAISGTSSTNQPVVMVRSMRLDNVEPRFSQDSKPNGQTMQPASPPERESAITGLEFRIGTNARFLATGSMKAPMDAMRACAFDLIRSWGFDPQVQSTLSRSPGPRNYPGNWVTSSDYPSKALLHDINGLVEFRLNLDESGEITGCRVLARTSPDAFGDHTCNLIKRRARLTGALDKDGNPVKSFYVGAVRWVVPTR
jgi:hypothetical protein